MDGDKHLSLPWHRWGAERPDFFPGTPYPAGRATHACSSSVLLPPGPEAEKKCPGLETQLSGLFMKPVKRCDTRGRRDGTERPRALSALPEDLGAKHGGSNNL